MVLFCKCHHCVFHEYVITISNSDSDKPDKDTAAETGSVDALAETANKDTIIDNSKEVDEAKPPIDSSNTQEVDVNSNSKKVEVASEIDEAQEKLDTTAAEANDNSEQPEIVSNIEAEKADIEILDELINPNEEQADIET